jgi:peptide-methionine (S)-S-oxide reductase
MVAGAAAMMVGGWAVLGAGPRVARPSVAAPAVSVPVAPTAAQRLATFAGGCFWSMQKAFDGVKGVVSVTAGFAGGFKVKPTYAEVSGGGTGHAESVQIVFDPKVISYDQLLEVYWHHIDPTTLNAAFCDEGEEYRSVIFVHDATERRLAEASKDRLVKSGRFTTPIVTTIENATPFYPAEDYHQRFYVTNPGRYQSYRLGCGQDRRLKQLWGDEAGVAQASR